MTTIPQVNNDITVEVGADARGPLLEIDAMGHDVVAVARVLEPHVPTQGEISVWVDHPTDALDTQLSEIGLTAQRDLYLMEVALPLATQPTITTRPFQPGRDEQAWVDVNNRAFSWHREQSGWTTADVLERMAEPWFDADGFLIHEDDGALLGFCWTKLHLDVEPPAGEIYVIAVDPAGQGRGLGRELTVAGLASIHKRGLMRGILYVDADNTAAVSLYVSLGFRIETIRRLYNR